MAEKTPVMRDCIDLRPYFAITILFIVIFSFMLTGNRLLFHTLIEGISIVVFFSIFILTWNTRRLHQNNFLILLGISMLFTGVLDGMHLITFKNMGIIVPGQIEENIPTQLWVAARLIQAISLLAAVMVFNRKVNCWCIIMLSYVAVTAILISLIFNGIFPQCFDIQGLTNFKILSEYFISFVFIAALILFDIRRPVIDKRSHSLIIYAIAFVVMSEIAFTWYVDVNGLTNGIGHLLKFASVMLMYLAIVDTGLKRPFHLIFTGISDLIAKERGFFAEILEKSGYIMLVMDTEGNIQDSSHAFENLIGKNNAELKNVSLFSLISEEDSESMHAFIDKIISEGGLEFEITFTNLAGEARLIHFKSALERFDAGDIHSIMCAGTDVTELVSRVEAEVIKRDELTGLLSRSSFAVSVRNGLDKADSDGEGTMLVLFDINKMKAFNLQHGREIGDKAIATLADALRTTFNITEIIGRVGDDRFAVFAPIELNITTITIKDRLHYQLKRSLTDNNLPSDMTTSVGFVLISAENQNDIDGLLKAAEDKMV
jgi:diguanylate cyclase (GGDEF)-like protein/PAS domain S-box-containing protein